MNQELYHCYLSILERELVPAMGCTEPIAIAYAGALARKTLGKLPQRIELIVSGNIIKNVKSVIVPHTGGRKGDEVVQLYVSPASGQPLKPIQLKGFGRVTLEPGQSKEVDFKVSPDQLAWWSEAGWTISAGDYKFCVGSSSRDLPLQGVCTLTGKDKVKALRDEYFSEFIVK